jgi:hypothetical protein
VVLILPHRISLLFARFSLALASGFFLSLVLAVLGSGRRLGGLRSDLWCCCLTSGFRASGARSGAGYFARPDSLDSVHDRAPSEFLTATGVSVGSLLAC